MRTCCASALYAASRLGLSSSKGTSTVSLTRVGLSASVVAFTPGGSPVIMLCGLLPGTSAETFGRTGTAERRGQPNCGRGGETRTPDLLHPKQAREPLRCATGRARPILLTVTARRRNPQAQEE